jgi:ATP-dependent helicase/DNAse subunit B
MALFKRCKDGFTPCGGYYFDLNDEFTDSIDINNYKMTGMTLSETEVLQKTDKNLTQTGEALTVNIKNSNNKLKGDILPPDAFLNYIKYSVYVSENAAKQITDGNIIPSPYKNCDYCVYKGICGYDENKGEYNRTVENINAEYIVQAAINKEKGGDNLE